MLRCVVYQVVPALAFATGVLTLAVPVIIALANHSYLGGLSWPFVADLSRDFPSSVVFTIGLNVLAVLLGATWVLNYRRHQLFLANALLEDAVIVSFVRLSVTCNTLGATGALMLPLYVLVKVATLPHRLAGAVFMILEALACVINSVLNYRICIVRREELETGVFVTFKYTSRSLAVDKLKALKRAKRSFLIELACSALCLMSVFVYLPILYKVIPAKRLTVDECESRGFGDHYCNDSVRLNDHETALWNYEMDFAGYQVRAFAQLGSLLTLLTYLLSFIVSHSDDESDPMNQDVSRQAPLLASPSGDDKERRGRRRSRSRAGSPAKRASRVRSPSNSPPKRSSFSSPRASPANAPRNYSYISV
ncbi:hypothetical protein Poli38472_006992 [Pythium oligandrum]|uniref:Uncharacterized protein n=1 Tax=Pythium oligandrum TaxID=41045 RepID=A0A8K1FGL9_PYTOL|nr:hypothetical protein Poli38472_006992 [Pythium oligandrum]|eukprot:TMW58847.1 hypothetical protein Poli38472_006992 [Pythium oligandrum]